MDRMSAALAGLLYGVGRLVSLSQNSNQKSDLATLSDGFVRQHVPPKLGQPLSQPAVQRVAELADRLAAGGPAPSPARQPSALLSVFCQIGEDPARRPAAAYLPLQPLTLDEKTLFPSGRYDTKGYATLWQGFEREAAALKTQADAETYLESLYHLLHRYAWCVPSAAEGVSLFDHSRVTAALAASLADLDEETVNRLLQQPDEVNTPLAVLVKGDISRVQRFIYTLTSKGAAKGLRGRSFYLQLLNEAIARYLLREMHLPVTSLIYAGGGHFYLLVPPKEFERLSELQKKLEKLLLDHHDGALYLALGWVRLCAADFQAQNFGSKWREVGQAVSAAKQRCFAGRAAELGVFEPRGHGGNEEGECQVCHAERQDVLEDDEGVRKCALCRSLEDLGGALGRSQVLALGQIEPVPQRPGRWEALLAALGLMVAPLDDMVEKRLEGWKDVARVTVLGLREFPDAKLAERVARAVRCPVAAGVRYTVNVTPHKGHEVATFEDLQKASTGLQRLGVLRMDVDDLGYLFGQGFGGRENGKPRNLATLARVASLSSLMSLFFEGWVGKLCQDVNNKENNNRDVDVLYTIYSGGDDLFIVGAWDVLPGLARTIREDLGRFAAGNPYVHVSAGITLHGGKYPLYLAAEDAKGALDDAKDLPGKDALTFLGYAQKWGEWKEVEKRKKELYELVGSEKVGRSLLQVLQRMYRQYQDVRDALAERGGLRARNGHEQMVWGPYMWQSAYLLTRLAERVGHDVKEQVIALRDQLSAKDFCGIETVGLAARWAEALTRSKVEDKEGDK